MKDMKVNTFFLNSDIPSRKFAVIWSNQSVLTNMESKFPWIIYPDICRNKDDDYDDDYDDDD